MAIANAEITTLPSSECRIAGKARVLGHTWFLHCLHDRLEQDLADERFGCTQLLAPPNAVSFLDEKIGEAESILEVAIREFSPAQLVDQVPLVRLSAEICDVIKVGVHARYLDAGIVQPLCHELALALLEMKGFAVLIDAEWNSPHRITLVEKLIVASKRLSNALENLPSGYVLP